MRHFSLPLAVLALALGFTGTAVAGPAPPGTSTEPTVPTQTGIAISVDRVLVKLGALEDKLVALTAKHDALTVKHDALTVKHDALTLKTSHVYSLLGNTSDHVTSSFFSLRNHIDRTCDVVAETRLYAAHASTGHAVSNYQHVCP